MGIPDGYNTYPSIEGQNNADNDETTDLVVANADGTIVEREEFIQSELNDVKASLTLTGDAVVANVLAGKTFYKDNAQTKLTGTMPDSSADITPDGTAIVIPEGYHDGTKHVTADADLVTGNIKSGVNIYGVAGKTEVVDTTEVANAAAEGDIAAGKIAFVNGVKITGTHV